VPCEKGLAGVYRRLGTKLEETQSSASSQYCAA
jgi:hypothetical protein